MLSYGALNNPVEGPNTLHRLVEKNDLEGLRALLEKEAPVDARDQLLSQTPLHVAVRNTHLESTEILTKFGADPNLSDSSGSTALHKAVDHPYPDYERQQIIRTILKTLVQAGARLDEVDGEGRTPLHVAVENANIASVKFLLAHRAPLNLKDKRRGFTPLHCVVRRDLAGPGASNLEKKARCIVAHLLLDAGADINEKTAGFVTPLHLAILHRDDPIIQVVMMHAVLLDERWRANFEFEDKSWNLEDRRLVRRHNLTLLSKTCVSEIKQMQKTTFKGRRIWDLLLKKPNQLMAYYNDGDLLNFVKKFCQKELPFYHMLFCKKYFELLELKHRR